MANFSVDFTVPSQAMVFDLERQNFLPVQIFLWDNITICTEADETITLTWTNWVPAGATWNTVPYVSWAAIPSVNTQSMYIGTEAGYVMRFFQSATDNGNAIPYNATWGLRAAPQLTQSLKPSWLELYLKQIPTGPSQTALGYNEAIEADINSFIQPLDATPINITDLAIALADQSTFFTMIEPGALNPANLPINWIQFVIQGAGNPSSGNFFYSGATLYTNLDDKPDYSSVGGVPTR